MSTNNILKSLELSEKEKRSHVLKDNIELLFRNVLGLKEQDIVNYDETVYELGLDSLLLKDFVEAINSSFEGKINLEVVDVYNYPTINKLCSLIASKLDIEGVSADDFEHD